MSTSNPSIAEAHWPRAAIAGAFQTGVVGVRNLLRHGVDAVSFDCNPRMQGFRSVYGPSLLCPDPDTETGAWLQFMRDLSAKLGSNAVLIPSSDRYVLAIANNREELAKYFTICPGVGLQGELALKQTQYRLAKQHGMPMPTTEMADDRETLVAISDRFDYPCVLKPWHFREWQKLPLEHPLYREKVGLVNNADELIAAYDSVAGVTPNVVVQEVILGADTNKRVFLSCYDSRGERIARAMFRERRCVPVGMGPASVSEPWDDPGTDEVCDRFLRDLGYIGICEIEAKYDDRDGQVKLIEANPRLSGGGDAAPHAGVNLIWLHYLDMIGERVNMVEPSKRRFQHIVFRDEGVAIPAYWKAGLLGWRELLATYKPPVAFFDLDWRDWRNSLETLMIFFRSLLREIFRR